LSAAYVLTRGPDGVWDIATDIDGDARGAAVDADTIVLADESASLIRVLTRTGVETWSVQVEFSPSDVDPKTSGYWTAIDGNSVLVGAPTLNGGLGAAYLFILVPREGIEVAIDVKPNSHNNVINPRSRGRIWVAVLSGSAFDALQVDPSSVDFGPGAEAPDRNRAKDVNRDRLPDFMLRFRMPNVAIACGDTEVELTGQTYAGGKIYGRDSIRTTGCRKKRKK